MVRQLLGAAAIAVMMSVPAWAQITDGVVKVGVLTDMGGTYSDLVGPGSVLAARMAIEDFGGEAKGLKVEMIAADHQNKADVGVSIARQWIDREQVDVIVDVPTTSVVLAINDLVREKNKVVLVSGAAASDLTGPKCSPNTVHWTYDTWSLANSTGRAVVKTGGDTWFFVTADYVFGNVLERDTTAVVEQSGGKVLGSVRHPFPGTDFSSFLLAAQASKAKIIALANSGDDTITTIKQAAEFGITQHGQSLAGLLVFASMVKSVGLQTAQGLVLTEAWYWDLNDETRAFAKRFADRNGGRYPSMAQAGVYSAVTHYLKAVAELKSDGDGKAVVEKMKAMPTNDRLFGKGSIRADGRKLHPMYLFEVKKPSESSGPWDLYKQRAVIPAEEAFRPLKDGGCPLVQR